MLVPAPDYPLWTAAVERCPAARCTTCATKAPAGCPTSTTSAARSRPHQGHRRHQPQQPDRRAVPGRQPARAGHRRDRAPAPAHRLRRRIYDKTLYDGHTHTSIASLADDVLFVTFNGLSKNYRSCGYRAGWMVVSGDKRTRATTSRPEHAGLDAAVLQHARASWRSRPRWAATRASRTWWWCRGRLCRSATWVAYEPAHADPGRQRGQAEGGAVHVPAARPQGLPDRRRPAVRLRAAGRGEGADRAGHRASTGRTPDHFRLVFPPNVDDLPRPSAASTHFLAHYRKRHATRASAPIEPKPRPIHPACSASAPSAAAPSGAAAQPGRDPPPRRPRHRDHDGGRPRHRSAPAGSSATRRRW